jgi:hypothetical protein
MALRGFDWEFGLTVGNSQVRRSRRHDFYSFFLWGAFEEARNNKPGFSQSTCGNLWEKRKNLVSLVFAMAENQQPVEKSVEKIGNLLDVDCAAVTTA